MIHTATTQPSVTARAQHTWHGLGTAAKSVILTAAGAVLVGAGYLAGTMQTPTPNLSITIYDPATKTEQNVNMCSSVRAAVHSAISVPEMPDAARAQFKRAVEARCP